MMKLCILTCVISAFWQLGAPVSAEIHGGPRTFLIPYDSHSSFALGDGVDITNLAGPRKNCIDLNASARGQDAPNGTSEIHASISVIKNMDDLETKLDRSLSLEASLSGSYIKFAQGRAQTNLSKTYSRFLREVRSSLMLSVRVVADHGRTWLDYRLRPEARQLIAENRLEDFRQMCGSHFIRAERHESALEYDVIVTGLARETKDMLAKEASASFETKGGTGGISATARGSVQDSLKSFVRVARHFGQISINARLVGAPSIATLAPALTRIDVSDPASVNELFSNWGKVLEGFEGSKGVTRDFILLKYNELPEFDQADEKFAFLGEVTKRLMLVEQLLQDYASHRESEGEELWKLYFKGKAENLKVLQDRLISAYTKCSSLDECPFESLPSDAVGFSIEDILYNGKLKATCGWGVNTADERSAVLSDIAVYWYGWMNFPNFVDADATRSFRIDASGNRHAISLVYGEDMSVDPNVLREPTDPTASKRHGPGRAIIQFEHRSFGEDEVVGGNVINHGFLDRQRTDLAKSQFGVEFHFPSGRIVTQTLGYPDFRQCPKMQDAQ